MSVVQHSVPKGGLKEEIAFYNENLDEYVRELPGRILLIHGSRLSGHFETIDAAIAAGYRRFGTEFDG